MDLSKLSMKKIRELIIFTVLLVVALWKFEVVIDVLKTIWGIIFPFVLGGAIAFVINVPMSFLEKKIFGKTKDGNKVGKVSKTDQSSSHNYIGGWCDRTSNVWCDSTAYSDNGKFDDKYCEFCSTDAKLDSRFFTQ